MAKILSKEKFIQQNPVCKFRHEWPDQEGCTTCNGVPEKCPEEKRAYKKYLKQFSNNAALIVMMKAHQG